MPTLNLNKAEFLKSAVSPSGFLAADLPCIVFAGKSNVGKSSVINRLLNRRNFARVGSQPGKTVHVNYFCIDRRAYFVDLPGYGYAKVSHGEKERWGDLIETYFNSERRIGLVFQLIDMRHAPTKDDLMMVDFLIENEFPFVVVLTKKDKLSKKQQEERLRALQTELPCADQIHMVPFSAMNGDGVEELRAIIDEISQEDLQAEDEAETEEE